MTAEIVEDDDIAPREGGQEDLLDIDAEQLAIDRSVEQASSVDAVMTQGGQEGNRVPMAMWCFADEPLAAGGPAMTARRVGLGPGLVDEDQARQIKPLPVIAAPPPILAGHNVKW